MSAIILLLSVAPAASYGQKKEGKEEKKKEVELYKVERLTQAMGLYSIGPVSPDRRSILLLAHKPEQAPNLYVMNLEDRSIRPPLSSFKWGVEDPRWSPDGLSATFSGSSEFSSLPEIYTIELKSGKVRQITNNGFSDRHPVYTPDGKKLLFTSDASPLPDAAFGILHIAVAPAAGGKAEYFTEDDGSSILPAISPDNLSALLVKVDEHSGRHSLWEYGFDGRQKRDLTKRKFARINGYKAAPSGDSIVIWGQEEAEQQDTIYLLDLKSGAVRDLPDPDLPKRSPTVSADGRYIAFVGPSDKGTQLYVYDSTTGLIEQITMKPGNTFTPAFISNTEIIFGSNRDHENEVYYVNLLRPQPEQKK
jgi:Tol biopolymer transport system component